METIFLGKWVFLPPCRMTTVYNGLWNANGNQEITCHELWGYLVMKSNIDIYLLTCHAGGQSRKNLGFPSFYAKIKKTSTISLIFYPFRWEIMPVVTRMSWLSFRALPRALLSDLLLTGILREMGITNTIMSRREHGCRRLNDMLQATQMENSRASGSAVRFRRSCSFHINYSPFPPSPRQTYFLNATVFHLGPFSSLAISSERYSSMKEQKLLKLLSHWFYKSFKSKH